MLPNQYTKKDASAEQGSAAREREATTARSVRAVEKVATQCSDRKHLPLANCHSDTMANPLLNKESTAQQVAQRTGVSERTMNRDTKFAQDIDAIALKLNISPQEVIASDLTKKAVSELKDKPVEVIRNLSSM